MSGFGSPSVADAPTREIDVAVVVVPPRSRLARGVRTAAWVAFAAFCLMTFTILKLPEDRIRGFVHGNISALLAPKGITFSAAEGRITIGWGLSYVMKDVTLGFPPPDAPAHIDKVVFSPSLLPLLLGRQGGKLWVYNKDGSLTASFWVKGTQMSAAFNATKLDLGRLGVLPLAAGIKGTGIVDGSGDVSGDMAALSTLSGEANLKLTRVVIDQQTLYGFSVPRLNIMDGTIDLVADKGKATLRKVQVGKPGDDIQATATGDILLGKALDSSTLNVKTRFSLSENVLKAFILIDALLGPGKQPDGSYAYNLTGPVSAPVGLPAPPQ